MSASPLGVAQRGENEKQVAAQRLGRRESAFQARKDVVLTDEGVVVYEKWQRRPPGPLSRRQNHLVSYIEATHPLREIAGWVGSHEEWACAYIGFWAGIRVLQVRDRFGENVRVL